MTRILALAVGIALAVGVAAAHDPTADYDRGDWRHWTDADRDCQDTRQEVLIAESLTPVVLDARGCKVLSGTWRCRFGGEVFTDPRKLDVDHMVPLANAHKSGAWAWTDEQRKAYANELAHPEHLIAVSARLNRQKGARGPEEFRPPREEYWCQYAGDWLGIKARHGLTLTAPEAEAVVEMLGRCK